MKKILLSFILILLFIPVLVNAETCDNDKVYIDSISIDKNNNVAELQETTANGKNINLTLNMSNVGDNIRYKIVIKNDSNEDYLLDKNSINISSKYIDYTIESDNSNVVKAKSSKTIYLRVNYSHQVPKSAYEGGLFTDEINMKVNLSSNNLSNPNTGIKYILFISLVALLMIGIIIIYRKKKISKLMILIIGLSMFIPISVYALCRCDINITSNVYISDEVFNGVIYRTSSQIVYEGYSFNQEPGWAPVRKTTNKAEIISFRTKNECDEAINEAISNSIIHEGEYYCKFGVYGGINSYVLDPSQLNNSFYIKNEIQNGIVTKAQVCFISDKEVCFIPGENKFTENYNLLKNEEEWFNNNGGSCTFYEGEDAHCEINNIINVNVSNIPHYLISINKPEFLYCDMYSCKVHIK